MQAASQEVRLRRLRYSMHESPLLALVAVCLGILSILISLPWYIPLIIVLPIISGARWLLLNLYIRRSPLRNLDVERMSGMEARWMSSGGHCIAHAVLVFDQFEGLTMNHIQRIICTRVLPGYPRLTRLPVSVPLSAGKVYCWIPDSQFSISRHLFFAPESISTKQGVQSYVAQLMQQKIVGKPPWEFHVILPRGENLDTVIIARVHQSIADGSELLRILCHSLADSPSIDIPERPQFSNISFGLNALCSFLVGPCKLFIWLWITTMDFNPLKDFCGLKKVTISWSASITLPKVTRIKQVTRTTVNCVILSALAGAVRALLQGCGIRRPPNVKVLIPVDIRSQAMKKANSTALGNKTTTMMIPLPVSVEGCVPRLWATRKTLSSLKSYHEPVLLYLATLTFMAIASPSTVCYFLDLISNKTTLQYSSLVGPSSYLSVGGGRLKEMYCLMPAITRRGLSVSCTTYADQVLIAVSCESTMGEAAHLLLAQIEKEVDTLWQLLQNRRAPGSNRMLFMPQIIDSPAQEELDSSSLSEIRKKFAHLDRKRETETPKIEYPQLVELLKRRMTDVACFETVKNHRSWSHSLAPRIGGFNLKLSPHGNIRMEKSDSLGSQKDNENNLGPKGISQLGTSETSGGISQKHRKNSFEIVRLHNKKKDYCVITRECFTELPKNNSFDESDSEREEREADYCDSAIKISDDEDVEAGPINPALRDLYYSNYLDHKLAKLKQQQSVLSQKFAERNIAMDEEKIEEDLLI